MTPQQRYYQANKERVLKNNEAWRQRNRSKVNALEKKRYRLKCILRHSQTESKGE